MNRNVSFVIVAVGTQSLQSSIIFITFAWYFTTITESAVAFGSLMAFRYIPGILLTMLSGVAIDRTDKITLGLGASIWHLITLCIFLVIGLNEVVAVGAGYWVYVALVVIMGMASAVLSPLERTLTPILSNEGELKSVNSVITALSQVTSLIGTSIAGIMIAVTGFGVTILLAISLSIVSISCYFILKIRVHIPRNEKTSSGTLNALKESFQQIKKQNWIVIGVLSAVFTNMAFVMIMDAALPYLFADISINGSAALGVCFTAIGLGTLIGAALTFRMKKITFDVSITLYIISSLAVVCAGFLIDQIIFSILLFGIFGLLSARYRLFSRPKFKKAHRKIC
ncbi:hypothetical protein JCM19037_3238 [Geomicrobium sp. JCM 19037]|uniref:MFS transporter n=1 Tax=Geomicrobium sp. JCM 19037 TaxID=1460634 RepID=UPI00045F2A97|nr:MFS transporter [Geomicrobium sp. JCM 19037]GAK04790.1 hypothetical protein JCM19037_3238 [Geomicrobium sp. JCM 19037]